MNRQKNCWAQLNKILYEKNIHEAYAKKNIYILLNRNMQVGLDPTYIGSERNIATLI
jgi:hypothetical protein